MSPVLDALGLPPFRQCFPWWGPDLQTIRDSLRPPTSQTERAPIIPFPLSGGDCLLGRLDVPQGKSQGLVVVVHGLGGGSDAEPQRRLTRALTGMGFAVLRLNLRGAGPGRPLAKGTYAANCTADLLPVLKECRRLAAQLVSAGEQPCLGAVGLSLGGTVLLNALLDGAGLQPPLLDGLVCVSSPLDLAGCAERIGSRRNTLYQGWLLRRLIAQTSADPDGLSDQELQALRGVQQPKTIRTFDERITAPRWGFSGVMAYYEACSPLPRLRFHPEGLPKLLLVHAKDDPWVPVEPALALSKDVAALRESGSGARGLPEIVITAQGGHNGFHAPGDTSDGCWSDRLASLWLRRVLLPSP